MVTGQEMNKVKQIREKNYAIPELCTYWFMYVFNQADAETDEVYAQMTLQPVSKVGHSLNF